ncbi:hypothetical protein LguiB_032067 [Lonicera macranthoides]
MARSSRNKNNHKSDIDSWVNFALRKRVRKLELKLEPADLVDVSTIWNNYYPFSTQSLGYSNISFLTSLNMECVNMTGEFDWKGKPEEREVQRRENCSMHKCLEVLELVWFHGSTTDVELATYLFSSAPFLKKIIIDARNHHLLLGTISSRFREEENVSAKECVRRLTEQLSPSAELLTL